MTKNLFIATAIVLLTAFAFLQNGFGQTTQKVIFKRGAHQAVVSGNLNGFKDRKVFIVRVRKNQTLKTEQSKADSSAHYITVSIQNPSGEDIGDSDASCNNRKEIQPTERGNYKITVFECGKADAWRGRFRLKITVE